MTTPPPLTPSAFPEGYVQAPEPRQGRPLDFSALVIIAASIGLVGVGLAVRSAAYQQTLTQTIRALVSVGDQLWVALPDELLQINSTNNTLQRMTYKQMGLPSPITYAVKARNNYWVQLYSGQVWQCDFSNLPCQQVVALGDGEDHYFSIAVLPTSNQIVAVNNFSAQIMTLDADSRQIIAANIPYSAPSKNQNATSKLLMKTAGELDGWREGKLYRPNRLHVINNMLVQTDTGNHRVVGWPLDKDGVPEWQTPIDVVKYANQQTYDVAYITHQDPQNNLWLVLEAGSVLGNGHLMSYIDDTNISATAMTPSGNDKEAEQPAQHTRAFGGNIPLGVRDPTLMTQLDDHSVLIADTSLHKILKVDYSPYSDAAAGIADYDVAALNEPLKALKKRNDFYAWVAKLALLFFFAPLIGILILYLRGYDLNQKLGK